MNKKRRTLLLVAVLLLCNPNPFGLCSIPSGNINIGNSQPNGLWNVIVYGLAKLLMALNGFLLTLGFGEEAWGWTIIVFTILIKLVTYPLSLKQLQSTKAQQRFSPASARGSRRNTARIGRSSPKSR